jgi:DNA-binding beta-propeller fold protein YncE
MTDALRKNSFFILTAGLILVSILASVSEAAVKISYMYSLSGFTGTIPYDRGRVSIDRERNETYVLYQNTVRVFNENGMEIYQFGDDLDVGHILDIAIDRDGDIFLLSYATINGESKRSIFRCNYRGETISKIELNNLPPDLSDFAPNRMIYKNGDFYFMSWMGMRVVVTDSDGNLKKSYDLISLLDLEEKDRGNVEVTGFSVDDRGNILFTVAVLFKAYILSPDGQVTSFGKPGGAPGRFNVVGGIVADNKGNFLVADKLKSAVMVFDSKFNFVTQFGYRGLKPGNLIVPDDIVIDKQDRIFVTQAMKRGVSVFKLTYN